VEAELLHVDGLTDMKKLTVAFRNSANAPSNKAHLRKICLNRKLGRSTRKWG